MAEGLDEMVRETLMEFGANEGVDGLEAPTPETPLYGEKGLLDSLALVSLIADLESKIEECMGIQVTLADERAMSRKRSPFRTVGSLVDFVREVVENTRQS